MLVVAPGCLGENRRWNHGEKPPMVASHAIPGVSGPYPDKWERVFVGQLPRPRLEGYVQTKHVESDSGRLISHFIYDADFKLAGLVSDTGKTTRVDRFGVSHAMGKMPMDQAILALLGFETLEKNSVHYVSMPAPTE
jgi:hypothetical protein